MFQSSILGDSYSSIQLFYRIPKQTISKIVPEVCDAIYETPHVESEGKKVNIKTIQV